MEDQLGDRAISPPEEYARGSAIRVVVFPLVGVGLEMLLGQVGEAISDPRPTGRYARQEGRGKDARSCARERRLAPMGAPAFDIDSFLAQPLVARLATSGPTVRPLWFLWEEGAFWIITGEWSGLPARIAADPHVSLVVDTCDLTSGEVLQVVATGTATIEPYDDERAYHKLSRYLGADRETWPSRFTEPAPSTTAMVRVVPDRVTARDLSYQPPSV